MCKVLGRNDRIKNDQVYIYCLCTGSAEPAVSPAEAAQDQQLHQDLRQSRVRGRREVQAVRSGY
jgi:hypothetical protein